MNNRQYKQRIENFFVKFDEKTKDGPHLDPHNDKNLRPSTMSKHIPSSKPRFDKMRN